MNLLFELQDIDTGQVLDATTVPDFERIGMYSWRPDSGDAVPTAFRINITRLDKDELAGADPLALHPR